VPQGKRRGTGLHLVFDDAYKPLDRLPLIPVDIPGEGQFLYAFPGARRSDSSRASRAGFPVSRQSRHLAGQLPDLLPRSREATAATPNARAHRPSGSAFVQVRWRPHFVLQANVITCSVSARCLTGKLSSAVPAGSRSVHPITPRRRSRRQINWDDLIQRSADAGKMTIDPRSEGQLVPAPISARSA